MSESLKKALRADIAGYESSLMTTPHLSRIRHAEAALLALLEEENHGAPARESLRFVRPGPDAQIGILPSLSRPTPAQDQAILGAVDTAIATASRASGRGDPTP